MTKPEVRSEQRPDFPLARVVTANDRFKESWTERLAWSTVIAAAVHAAVVAFSPAWEAPAVMWQPPPPGPLELTSLLPIESASAFDAALTAAIPVGIDPELTEEDPGGELSSVGEGPGEADPTYALQEGLFGRSLPLPSVTMPEDEPEPELELEEQDPAPEGEGGEETVIGGSASAADVLSSLEGDDLDLDFLSSVRPELALMSPSAWLSIRNPVEVENFMKRSYRLGGLDPDIAGLVGVALWIDESGSVEWAEISRSSGWMELDEVVLELFNEVVAFRPARERGVSMATSAIFWVAFPW
jgi:TonB family protein